MKCRWDRDAEDYLIDGQPCRTDDYGDPTRHCTARRNCARHIGPGELTCALHISDTRQAIRRIVEIWPLMDVQALGTGVNSEAFRLACPATDVREWAERRVAMMTHLLTWERLGRITAKQYYHGRAGMEDDDEEHPYTVLTRWHMMFAEDYGHTLPDEMSLSDSAAYLQRHLHRIAQDPEQDFPLFAREIRHCRDHLWAVIRNSSTPTKGAPCPDCLDTGHVVRLHLQHGHWCDDPECQQQYHFTDDSGDRWVCPKDRQHWMTAEGYAQWIQDREARPKASA